jgi:outer membrane protein
MKKNFYLILCFFLVLVQSVNSQTKVAHVDTYELITNMPEMLAVQEELSSYSKEKEAEIRLMEAEIRSISDKYSDDAINVSQEENEKRQKEIQVMQENIRLFTNQIVKELQEKERSLTEPILEKVISAIKEVGKENGYDYVLDSSKNQGVILADGDDLMEKVKIKLGF